MQITENNQKKIIYNEKMFTANEKLVTLLLSRRNKPTNDRTIIFET